MIIGRRSPEKLRSIQDPAIVPPACSALFHKRQAEIEGDHVLENSSKIKFKALPFQIIPLNAGVVIRRGASQAKIGGEEARDVIEQIVKAAAQGACVKEIVCLFPEIARASVTSLIDFLITRNFLIPFSDDTASPLSSEKSLDIFYWHFEPLMKPISTRVRETRLALVGVNSLTQELLAALGKSHFQDVQVVDDPDFRDSTVAYQWNDKVNPLIGYDHWNRDSSWESIQCMIVCSDVGGGDLFHEWNQLCISHGVYFLPIVLKDLIGFIGPLVLPGETACYECLTRRENSHLDDSTSRRIAERSMPEGRAVIGYHPTMYSVVANLAAFEVLRFFSETLPGPKGGTLIEINLLAMAVQKRKVLKLPRCNACSSMINRPSISLYRNEAVDESREKS
jgi:bacteriocin biosynthesis cyclodehydratase domain-containing protein